MARKKSSKTKGKNMRSTWEAAVIELVMKLKTKNGWLQIKKLLFDDPSNALVEWRRFASMSARCGMQRMHMCLITIKNIQHVLQVVILTMPLLTMYAIALQYLRRTTAPIAYMNDIDTDLPLCDNVHTHDFFESFDEAAAAASCHTTSHDPNHALTFEQQLEMGECGMVPTATENDCGCSSRKTGASNAGTDAMSDEARDITAIMSQLQQNAIGSSHNPFEDVFEEIDPPTIRKAKKKRRKRKKPKKHTETGTDSAVGTDHDHDDASPIDVHEFAIDDVMMDIDDSHRHTDINTDSDTNDAQSGRAWKPRRVMSPDNEHHIPNTVHNTHLEPMDDVYKHAQPRQLNKMHYASDKAYEQLVQDISAHGLSQLDIFHKYRINFIPNEATFKLIPPPSIMDVRHYHAKYKHYVHSTKVVAASANVRMMDDSDDEMNQNRNKSEEEFESINIDSMKSQMRAGSVESKSALQKFYALTRMQQKYLTPLGELKHDDAAVQLDDDNDDVDYDASPPQASSLPSSSSSSATHDTDNRSSAAHEAEPFFTATEVEEMNVLRTIHQTTPVGILHRMLNDEKLPQWLYEGDTILDLNCGIGDALIYLLQNLTSIRGICVVGTSRLKYKYATLNVAMHDLSSRIEIVGRDLYHPYVTSRFYESAIIYIDWYNADHEYLHNHFTAHIMNDQDIRAAKPGRVILSYNRQLFDAYAFQASYTLHFSRGWHLPQIQPTPLPHDVKMYMYSIPLHLSKLSNVYVQNYQMFYGYKMVWTRVDDDGDEQSSSSLSSLNQPITMDVARSKQNILRIIYRNSDSGDKQLRKVQIETAMHRTSGTTVGDDHNEIDDIHDFVVATDHEEEEEEEDQQSADTAVELLIGLQLNTDDFSIVLSQLLYESFINAIENVVSNDVEENEYTEIFIQILNANSERHETASHEMDDITDDDNDDSEWQFLQHNIFTAYNVDSCQLYEFIDDEW
eukprot:CAMPEP_0202689764 /NCGR_PEP_ID=MMETSP1385-20130828/4952_1 /ASSEMBLY_ACC=CAM_ASM_000861 /TAXON_ID=933848 /ORGANISM="Elphidium margaritaceum" /LENGTH=962 /DNA_ID=CAMNT_0049344949 /DNA_START=34 /DNA_END=2919 /DNA_ORIENTATION=-